MGTGLGRSVENRPVTHRVGLSAESSELAVRLDFDHSKEVLFPWQLMAVGTLISECLLRT